MWSRLSRLKSKLCVYSPCICYYDLSSVNATQYANRNPVHFNNFDHIFSNVFSVLVYCFPNRALFQFNPAIVLKTRNENKCRILQFFCSCYYICLFANWTINSRPNYCLHGGRTQTGLLSNGHTAIFLIYCVWAPRETILVAAGCLVVPWSQLY